jgi:hypothetical protein
MKVVAKVGSKQIEGWLEPTECYSVLSINNYSTGTKFLIWSKKQLTAACYPASDFEIIDATLSSLWVAQIDLNGYVELTPKEWLDEGFWERFNDSDPDAEQIFFKIMALIDAEAKQETLCL